jgi:hypothetical protein
MGSQIAGWSFDLKQSSGKRDANESGERVVEVSAHRKTLRKD